MTDETKPLTAVLTWGGFVVAAVLAVGWYVDRSGLKKDLAKVRSDQAAAEAELAPLPPPQPTLPEAPPAPAAPEPALAQAGAEAPPEAKAPAEVASARSELTAVKSELTLTKQALGDSDHTRMEVGRKLQECQAQLQQAK